MRRLGEIERKEQRRKRISGIFIISLLLLSTLGFALSMVSFEGQSSAEEVQGFSNNGQYWIYTVGTQKYYFTHHVEEVDLSLYTIDKNLADFGGKQVYVDSQIDGGLQEVYNSLGAYIGRINEACYGECTRDLPEKDCSEPMIVIRNSETPVIREQDSCIFIEGDMKTLDAFLYKVLGITP
ncbi:hypothetical protein FJZ21_03345 [Candidatus Pacearchaeota archaeon]|nr:hypothetical protein [Candidatus Pacearchaeota archaeon]